MFTIEHLEKEGMVCMSKEECEKLKNYAESWDAVRNANGIENIIDWEKWRKNKKS